MPSLRVLLHLFVCTLWDLAGKLSSTVNTVRLLSVGVERYVANMKGERVLFLCWREPTVCRSEDLNNAIHMEARTSAVLKKTALGKTGHGASNEAKFPKIAPSIDTVPSSIFRSTSRLCCVLHAPGGSVRGLCATTGKSVQEMESFRVYGTLRCGTPMKRNGTGAVVRE